MTNKNIAVVGCGYWGKNLVRNFFQLDALYSICDENPDTIRKVLKDIVGDYKSQNFEEICSDPNVKGVVIALRAEDHFSYAKRALLSGKDVFVEKPLALEVAHAQELVALAKEKSAILMVGHLLQYHSAFQKALELLKSGELGRLEYIQSTRLSLGKIRREENALWSFAPHDVSMFLALTQELPTEVMCIGANFLHKNLADVTTTHLTFPSGINGHIFVSWLHPFKEQKLVLVAEGKMLVFDDTQPWEKKLVLYSHKINWQDGVPLPEKGEGIPVPLEPCEPLKNECQHFINCITSRVKPRTDGSEGLRVLQVLSMAQKSLEEHGNKTFLNKNDFSSINNAQEFFCHPSSFIDNNCSIGKGTKIWHYSHILSGAKIGKDCNIGQNVSIAGSASIGNNVKIQNNVSIYDGTEIEDDVFLGPSCVLTNVSNPRAEIIRHGLYEKTLLKKGCTIGANATIVCGTTIGKFAFIAAGSVVTKDIPDYGLVQGNPAKLVGYMSRHGHKLSKTDANGYFICPESGYRYEKEDNGNMKCLDQSEDTALPLDQKTGKKSYLQFR